MDISTSTLINGAAKASVNGVSIQSSGTTLSSATIDSAGTAITLVFSGTVTHSASTEPTLAATAGSSGTSPSNPTLTYTSGSGTNTIVYGISRAVNITAVETMTISYTSGGALSGVATFTNTSTTNNSTAQTYTSKDTFGADSSDSPNFADASTRTYITSEVVAGSSYVVTKVELRMKRVDGGGSAPDIVCEIRSDTGTAPGNPPLATSTNTIVSSDVSTSQGWIPLVFTGLSMSNGTHYYIGIKASTTSGTNYYTARSGSVSTGDIQQSVAGTTTWGATGTRPWYIRTYSSP